MGARFHAAVTAGGAVAAPLTGCNAGRGDGATYDKDVQRCKTVASGAPAYWNVTYNYRGTDHRIQMSAAPSATIAVNRNGEPRQ